MCGCDGSGKEKSGAMMQHAGRSKASEIVTTV